MTVTVILFLTALALFAVCFAGAACGAWWAQIRAPIKVIDYFDGEPPAPYPWSPEGLAERYHT